MKKMLEIKNFNTSFFIDRRAGRNDVVVVVDGREIYRQPRTRETYFAGFDVYVQHKYGIPLSEYEKRFKPAPKKRKYIATCTKEGEYDNFAPGIEAVTHYDIFLEDGKLYTEDHPSGVVRRYGYNPPATQSEAKTVADVLMQCRSDKRWTVKAHQ